VREHNLAATGTRDAARDLRWIAWPSFGEGWHHHHHAYPRSARHDLKAWESDIT
jgi:stearoyl-CoA desaturase (delta-9 desaturase)